ncbi:unnamed protein product [Dovyalis caffra]|uniref:Uncharacterized protein n=1 Tax=Dovyalis caffra TaxID=77055 RepID=A0AAV1R3A4_9ROSI|nr:unnamed protein product [Dovyalis caffra]
MTETSNLGSFNLLEDRRTMEKVVEIKQLHASKHEVRLAISFTFLMEIRRYIYSDVINRQDLCKLFNCSGIQVTAIYGGKPRKDECRFHHLKRRKLKQSRKGVPLRAPITNPKKFYNLDFKNTYNTTLISIKISKELAS